jgi:hypothetical protein
MAATHQWRRRRSAAPLLLAIVDHDTKRFTIEGRVTNDDSWITEVFRAQRAGRRIEFSLLDGPGVEEKTASWRIKSGYEQWPPKSIVMP